MDVLADWRGELEGLEVVLEKEAALWEGIQMIQQADPSPHDRADTRHPTTVPCTGQAWEAERGRSPPNGPAGDVHHQSPNVDTPA